MQLVVEKLAKSYGVQEIFKNVSFMLEDGEHLGLVGVNGSGKTTLLRCLLRPELADSGTVRFASGTSVGYVQQDLAGIHGSIWNFMLDSCPEILKLRSDLQALEARAAGLNGSALDGVLAEYAKVTQRYEHLDGYNYENRIKKILRGLGYDASWWQQDAALLSGGQKTRLMLAAALARQPDCMLLDEPTNHLDIVMTRWLENYLREFKGALLIVSHDRAFLDNTAQRILEMQAGRLQSFKGNYSSYLEQKAVQTATLAAAYAAQQDYIARTEAYIRRFKAGIKSRMARGRQSQLDRLERLEAPTHSEEFALRLPPAPECAERVLVMENLAIGYGAQILASNINLTLRRGEKAALIGPNGSGKTTLLKTLLGETEPLEGRVQTGNRVQVGYFSQGWERLKPGRTLLENFVLEYGFTEERTRALLGGMLFHGDEVFKDVGTLSGGQRARLALLKLVLDGANFLVLDEPTNHLDILARETLEAALAAYDGTILAVSHDRYFISEIAGRIWEIENSGITDYKGDYAYYLEEKAKVTAMATTGAPAAIVGSSVNNVSAPALPREKQKRYSREEAHKLLPAVELNIREQEAMLKLLERQMCDPANHADREQSAAMAREHAAYTRRIEELMEKWESLMEAAEE